VSPRHWLACAALLLAATACTETDDVNRTIGTTQLLYVDPGLEWQASDEPERIQAAEWAVPQATLIREGQSFDMTFGGECRFVDTVAAFARPEGACTSGLVIDSTLEPVQVSLVTTFSMQVTRVEPLILLPMDDEDGDGVANAVDNCPLVPNADQSDINMDGIGDACTAINQVTGEAVLDSDADVVPDVFDNCWYISNPLQEDSSDPVNGIGDACVEQTADVQVGGNRQITLDIGPAPLIQPLGRLSFLTPDFNDTRTLSCDWIMRVCELDPAQVRFCTSDNVFVAFGGCS
jgi:hypothetical protein